MRLSEILAERFDNVFAYEREYNESIIKAKPMSNENTSIEAYSNG